MLLQWALCAAITQGLSVAAAGSQKEGNAHLRLSKAIYNFTDTQDLRLAVGYRATVDEKGVLTGVRKPGRRSY